MTEPLPAPKQKTRISKVTLFVDCVLVVLVLYLLLVPLSAKVIDRQRPPQTPRLQLAPAAPHAVTLYTI